MFEMKPCMITVQTLYLAHCFLLPELSPRQARQHYKHMTRNTQTHKQTRTLQQHAGTQTQPHALIHVLWADTQNTPIHTHTHTE